MSENRRKFAEREEYIANVRNTMTRNAQARVEEIQNSRERKDQKIHEQLQQRMYELLLQKERDNFNRAQRQDTV